MKTTLSLKITVALVALTTLSLNAANVVTKAKEVADTATKKIALGICSTYGSTAFGAQVLNSTIPGLKDAAKKTCCKLSDFKSKNPNVVKKALDGCNGIDANNSIALEDACSFIALAGGALEGVPALGKSALNKGCCKYTTVMKANPKAATALSCPAA